MTGADLPARRLERPWEDLRVLIVHDWLVAWAGAERCVEQFLEIFPSADLIVGVLAEDIRHTNDVTRRAEETWLGKFPLARRHHRWFLPLEGLAFATLATREYDLVISSAHAFSKMVRTGPRTHHICYCHSPPRYLWDLRETYERDATWPQRLALRFGLRPLRWLDRRSAQAVDYFVGNSEFVRRRIQRCYGRDAEVIYPPVSMKPLAAGSQRCIGKDPPFLLSLGRLVPYKRVDLAIQAAERLQVQLVVAGDGPDRARLESLAGRYTEFRGTVSEEEAAELLSNCSAFVFCAEEDFGIAPVEANAHGAPAVAYRRGGACETMVDGVTAEFFDGQDVPSVEASITRALQHRWDNSAIQRNAIRFSPERFRSQIRASVERVVRGAESPHVSQRVALRLGATL
jgi:glycosyltransferase involved in cell wall biosynthesis